MSTKPDLFISTALNDREAIKTLNRIMIEGALAKVPDIQLRVEGDVMTVQYVDDDVVDVEVIEGHDVKIICERIKSRSGIAHTDFLSATVGRFQLHFRKKENFPVDRKLDVRVSIIPTDAGETFCLRLLAEMDDSLTLKQIAMSNTVRNEFNALLREQQGIFIVCGPVGSGKTTLLFSLLSELQKLGKNVKTIEDPVEIILPGIDQMQTSRRLSFADGVRAMVRQRMHVGLVGEVRDDETAEVSFRIGNTGSLIFFTIHADDAAMVISRCEDLGIDRQTFAQSVKLIVFTRLIGRLPQDVEYPRVEPSEASKNWLSAAELYHPTDRFIEVPETEFKGKVPLFEMIKITPEMRRAIVSSQNPRDVLEVAARQPQFETLAECAVRQARNGLTTLSAVQDLVGDTVNSVRSTRLDKQLCDMGVMTPEQQFECVELWGKYRISGKIVPLWKVITELGYANLEQIIDLVGLESEAQNRIDFFVERGYFSREKVQHLIDEWKKNEYRKSLFNMLLGAEVLTYEQVYDEGLLFFRRGGMLPLD